MSLFIHEFFLAPLVDTMPFVVQLLKEERQPFILPFARDSEISYFKTVFFFCFSVWYMHIGTCLCICFHRFPSSTWGVLTVGLPRGPQHRPSCSLGMTWPYHRPTVYRNDILFTHREVGFVNKNKDKGNTKGLQLVFWPRWVLLWLLSTSQREEAHDRREGRSPEMLSWQRASRRFSAVMRLVPSL